MTKPFNINLYGTLSLSWGENSGNSYNNGARQYSKFINDIVYNKGGRYWSRILDFPQSIRCVSG